MRRKGHSGPHGNPTCPNCGIRLSIKTASRGVIKIGHGACRNCLGDTQRIRLGQKRFVYQKAGEWHRFPCGCAGILPTEGHSNKFARRQRRLGHLGLPTTCRVSHILRSSTYDAKKRGHRPIPRATPHSTIRKMMEEPNCERCKRPLVWVFGRHKTPHLHHNHRTGEPQGFTHPMCNPQALEIEIDTLRDEIRRLKAAALKNDPAPRSLRSRDVHRRDRVRRAGGLQSARQSAIRAGG